MRQRLVYLLGAGGVAILFALLRLQSASVASSSPPSNDTPDFTQAPPPTPHETDDDSRTNASTKTTKAPARPKVVETTLPFWIKFMMGTKGGKECEEDYGMEFLRRWQEYGRDICLPRGAVPKKDEDDVAPIKTEGKEDEEEGVDEEGEELVDEGDEEDFEKEGRDEDVGKNGVGDGEGIGEQVNTKIIKLQPRSDKKKQRQILSQEVEYEPRDQSTKRKKTTPQSEPNSGNETRPLSETSVTPGDFSRSSIRCHSMMPSYQAPEPMNVCHLRNVAVDFDVLKLVPCNCGADFYGKDKTLFFTEGALRGNCEAQVGEDEWSMKAMPKTVGNWLVRAWKGDAEEIESRCTPENTVRHFVYFVSRYDTTNLFHTLEDWIHTFMAYSVLNIPLDDVQIVIADGLVRGPYAGMWQQLFSRKHKVLFMSDLYETSSEHSAGPGIRCFHHMAVNPFAAISPLCKRIGENNPCGNATLVKAFREFFITQLNLTTTLPSRELVKFPGGDDNADEMDDRQKEMVTITIVERNDYTGDEFVGSRTVKRKIVNHQELVKYVSDKFPQSRVRSVDFIPLGFAEQLRVARTTDILIGAHGAGLAHLMFMPSWGSVVELWIDDRYNNYHYANMARFLGLHHTYLSENNPVSVGRLLDPIRRAVAWVQKHRPKSERD